VREAEKIAFRTVRPKKGRPSATAYRWCPECRRRVTMPCVACATRKWQQTQKLNAHEVA